MIIKQGLIFSGFLEAGVALSKRLTIGCLSCCMHRESAVRCIRLKPISSPCMGPLSDLLELRFVLGTPLPLLLSASCSPRTRLGLYKPCWSAAYLSSPNSGFLHPHLHPLQTSTEKLHHLILAIIKQTELSFSTKCLATALRRTQVVPTMIPTPGRQIVSLAIRP